MTTLSLRAPQARPFTLPGFARAAFFLSSVLDVFAEALTRARIASDEYPFAA